MDYPVYFSEQLKIHLRSLRKAKGLSQTRLGQMLGVPQPRISELEAKPGAISVDTLFKLLGALDAQMLLRVKAKKEARASRPRSRGEW